MDLLKSINEQLAEAAKQDEEVRQFIAEMEAIEAQNLFRLDELFGSAKAKQKEKEMAAKRYAIERGKHGTVNKNKKTGWQGGVMGEGRLAELVKLYGKPTFDRGIPQKRPQGMSPEDYKIWIAGFENEQKDTDTGPAVGPAKNDVIRMKGKLYLVRGSKGLNAIARNKEGEDISIAWNELSKPKEVAGKQVFTVMSDK